MTARASGLDVLLLAMGALCGTSLLLSGHVAFVNAAIDPNNASSYPHMASGRFYYFIPFFAAGAAAVGVVAESVLFRSQPPFRFRSASFFLGLSYSAIWSIYFVGHFAPKGIYLLPLGLLLAGLFAFAVHKVEQYVARRV